METAALLVTSLLFGGMVLYAFGFAASVFSALPADIAGPTIRVLETHHASTYYIQREDVSAKLVMTARRSICEWKGEAKYFDVIAGSHVAPMAAGQHRT